MNPVTADIKDQLVNAGVGTFAATTGWGIFISRLPDSPDTAICLYDTGGPAPEHVQAAAVPPLRRPSFVVRVRGTTYLSGYDKMVEVCGVLDRIGSFTATGPDSVDPDVRYSEVFQRGDVTLFRVDEKYRFVFSCDFEAVRQET